MTDIPKNIRRDIDDVGMPPEAIILALGTFFMFAILDTTAKFLVVAGMAPVFVVWSRFTSQAVIFLTMHKAWSNRTIFAVNNWPLSILRGLLLPLTTMFNFAALQHLQLAETVTIFLASPMLVTALSGPILGEWAGRKRWAAILVGFIGVLLVVRPGTDVFTWPIVLSIGAMVSYSLYSILTRKLAGTESQDSLVFYSCIFGAILLAPFAWINASLPAETWHWGLLILTGIFGMTGHTLLVKASKISSAGKVSPFVYSQLLWMVVLGYMIFGDIPDLWTISGAAIICASGFYIMLRERKLSQLRKLKQQSAQKEA